LDFETEPFDNERGTRPAPFLAVLAADQFEDVVIWEENESAFCGAVMAAIEALPHRFLIYAHNGGKFDFQFLLHKLRGRLKFKGGRAIMTAQAGKCELRDSLHLIPEALKSYRKTAIDIRKLRRARRWRHRHEIIAYCRDDCHDLLALVKGFIARHGLKLTVGQAALAQLRGSCATNDAPAFERIGLATDTYLRQWYLGGRVECLAGAGQFTPSPGKNWKIFDFNSAYPHVMAALRHPIGAEYKPRRGWPGAHTAFIDCIVNNEGGAFIRRAPDGSIETPRGRAHFLVTIHEWNTARRLGLILDPYVNFVVDCPLWRDFAEFVRPLYAERQVTKARLAELRAAGIRQGDRDYDRVNMDDIFLKLILNSCYGKFGQDPRQWKEHFQTDIGARPPVDTEAEWELEAEYGGCRLWARPAPGKLRFNNVGTAASVTGAVRAMLMEAIHAAERPIYCDTDCVVCEGLPGYPLSDTELGAMKLEGEYATIVIAGKKLYAARRENGSTVIKSKGIPRDAVTYEHLVDMVVNSAAYEYSSFAPTLSLDVPDGEVYYMRRTVKATAPRLEVLENGHSGEIGLRGFLWDVPGREPKINARGAAHFGSQCSANHRQFD
jgi:hypothetical protein